jgi:hypothetical protein
VTLSEKKSLSPRPPGSGLGEAAEEKTASGAAPRRRGGGERGEHGCAAACEMENESEGILGNLLFP